jgi:ABC-type uncharacterized transport system permease subunit
LTLTNIVKEESFLDDEITLEQLSSEIPFYEIAIKHMRLDIDQRELILVTENNELVLFDVQNKRAPKLVDRVSLDTGGHAITTLEYLAGGISILVGFPCEIKTITTLWKGFELSTLQTPPLRVFNPSIIARASPPRMREGPSASTIPRQNVICFPMRSVTNLSIG